MALETLEGKAATFYNDQIKDEANTFKGCHIEVHDNQVHVLIPEPEPNLYKKLVFAKSEMRALLEQLYVN